MPKQKRRRLSTAALLDLAYRRLQESRELLRDFQHRKQALDYAYESRSWRRAVALDPPEAVIDSLEKINPQPTRGADQVAPRVWPIVS